MAYSATPYSTTGYSPFHLLYGQEMVLPKEGHLKTKISPDMLDVDHVQRLENLKFSLKKANKEVGLNRKANQKNKAYYKKTKEGKFEGNDKVYLFCPARKPGRCHKLR
jgi:hypothetical protein